MSPSPTATCMAQASVQRPWDRSELACRRTSVGWLGIASKGGGNGIKVTRTRPAGPMTVIRALTLTPRESQLLEGL